MDRSANCGTPDRVAAARTRWRPLLKDARILAALILALSAAGCGPRVMRLQETAREALPVTFTYGSLRPDLATFRTATDPRTGYSVERMIIPGHDEFAVVDVISVAPPYVFERESPRLDVTRMLNDRGDLSWGETGVVRGGGGPIAWQKFQKGDPPASCLAFLRPLDENADTRTFPSSQKVAAAMYCRSGSAPLSSAEVPAITGALRPES